jgi:molybdopterin converting factor small subunit
MDPFAKFTTDAPQPWSVSGLDPAPEDEWQRVLAFMAITDDERRAMLNTVETLLRCGHELVVDTYNYLLRHHETAVVLGWERGADPQHLAERRRFFAVWLARVIGLDLSDDLARYLFRSGQYHAGHGPRRTHVPPVYVTGSFSLVHAAFARYIADGEHDRATATRALSGWNKLLTAHLHMLQLGYQTALTLDAGDYTAHVALFGKLRTVTGHQELTVGLHDGAQLQHALRKVLNYLPTARAEIFDTQWLAAERVDHTGTPWFTPAQILSIKPMWRVLVNGKDVAYADGPATPICAGDEIHFFPPGR